MRLCLDVRFARTKFREIAYRFWTKRVPYAHTAGAKTAPAVPVVWDLPPAARQTASDTPRDTG